MECNKDEAARAKEIAEKKFSAKDVAGAKKFALKAQNLYPGLEGISQMIATLDVYVSAENRINGEADWYGILGVNPQADEETVRKQYRKLALILHPDKNKSLGADGAFKLISEAWSLLSDKTKRSAYDQKRNAKVFQKVPTPSGASSTKPGSNGFRNYTKSGAKKHKNTSRTSHSSTPAPSQKPTPNTFWTTCHRCKMQYEYLRVYLNHNLLCPSCHEPFLAVETAPPNVNGPKPAPFAFFNQWHNSGHQASTNNTLKSGKNNVGSSNVGAGVFTGQDSNNQNNFHWGPFSGATNATTAAQAANVVQQAYERVKREREEAQAVKRKSHGSKRMPGVSFSGQSHATKKRRGMEDSGPSNDGSKAASQTCTGSVRAGMSSLTGSRVDNFQSVRVNGITRAYNPRDASQFKIETVLMEKAKKHISHKLSEWDSGALAKSATKEQIENKESDNGDQKPLTNQDLLDQSDSSGPVSTEVGVHSRKHFPSTSDSKVDGGTLEKMVMNVPDPDFHDFDKDRTESCFGENQVWAVYDDDDGMPRYYAIIHNVISLNPFKMRISWLNSKTNIELGPINWVGSGFSKTCGDFRVGRHEVYDSLNAFSHKVRWTKGTRGVICVYPRKGDVWALYRNWSPDWNELTADEVIHKYEMVEVLEDYSEEYGVTVIPLVKVSGFKTVFHQHLDPREVMRIPREEMFRFSHYVPSFLLTGQEGPSAPKGCRELDPAATPTELLHLIADAKEEETLENEDKPQEEELVDNDKKVDNEAEMKSEKDGEDMKIDCEDNEVEILEDAAKSMKRKENVQ
uniref:J domain-containing protein n=1 Tax=Rhizophora mucronata TaxID=61149 RepID=A0A2P2KPD8_RHIMU